MTPDTKRLLLVAGGGLIGCVARYWLAGVVQRLGDHGFPSGTLAVNILGSLVIGIVMTLSLERGLVDESLRILLTTGFCGGFTTMSTFSYETFALLRTVSTCWPLQIPASRLPRALAPCGSEASSHGHCEDQMKITGQGKLLRIFVGESDTLHGQSLYEALVRKARALGLAGATVWRGIEGYGARSRIHTAKILRLSEDLPVIIEIVDSEEKIRAALPELDAMMEATGGGGLVTLEAAEIIKYTHGDAGA